MITAKRARILSGNDEEECKEALRAIEERIKTAAGSGGSSLIIRDEPYAYWLYSEKSKTKTSKRVISELENLGFKVSQYYEERQFVDIGLKIEW